MRINIPKKRISSLTNEELQREWNKCGKQEEDTKQDDDRKLKRATNLLQEIKKRIQEGKVKKSMFKYL
jgi:hypothetical protein